MKRFFVVVVQLDRADNFLFYKISFCKSYISYVNNEVKILIL